MIEKENYETILTVLSDKVKDQELKIGYLQWENSDLKRKLAEAEHHLNPTEASAKRLEIR